MGTFSLPSLVSVNLAPKISLNHPGIRFGALNRRDISSVNLNLRRNFGRRSRLKRLNAGLTEIEPDLNEDPVDRWETNSVSDDDFLFGEYDGSHTYFEGENDYKGTFWESICEDSAAVAPPSGFQGFMSWLFLPAIAAGMYYEVPGEYLYIGAATFTVVFCIIEMQKPDYPHNFEPQIYNMERGARDKLISDYNTMSIWDFNEKYEDVWDFTVKKDSADIMKR